MMEPPDCGCRSKAPYGYLQPSVGSIGRHVLSGTSSLLKRCQTRDHRGGQPNACRRAAMSPDPADSPLRFGRLEISPAQRVLRIGGRPFELGARAFDVLVAL